MTQKQALKELAGIANDKHYSAGYNTDVFSTGTVLKVYSVYIHGHGFQFGDSYQDAICKLAEEIKNKA